MTQPYHGPLADQYADTTWSIDLSPLRAGFTAAIRARAGGQLRILDLGCGSGRDALAFSKEGFRVDAMDASPDMTRIAAKRTALSVTVGRAQDVEAEALYDGIWACASLLHVPMAELPDVFIRLQRALVPGGVLYASFQWGHGERTAYGLHFTDMTPESAASLVGGISGLTLENAWSTDDARPERAGLVWLNLLASRPVEAADIG